MDTLWVILILFIVLIPLARKIYRSRHVRGWFNERKRKEELKKRYAIAENELIKTEKESACIIDYFSAIFPKVLGPSLIALVNISGKLSNIPDTNEYSRDLLKILDSLDGKRIMKRYYSGVPIIRHIRDLIIKVQAKADKTISDESELLIGRMLQAMVYGAINAPEGQLASMLSNYFSGTETAAEFATAAAIASGAREFTRELIDIAAEDRMTEAKKESDKIAGDIAVKLFKNGECQASNHLFEDMIKFLYVVSSRFNLKNIAANISKYPADADGKVDFNGLDAEEKDAYIAQMEILTDFIEVMCIMQTVCTDNTYPIIGIGTYYSLKDFCEEKWDIKTDDVEFGNIIAEKWYMDISEEDARKIIGIFMKALSKNVPVKKEFLEKRWKMRPEDIGERNTKINRKILEELQPDDSDLTVLFTDPAEAAGFADFMNKKIGSRQCSEK